MAEANFFVVSFFTATVIQICYKKNVEKKRSTRMRAIKMTNKNLKH